MIRSLLACVVLCLSACTVAAPATSVPMASQPADSARWEPDIAAFEEADSRVRRMPGGVVFVGSSSIRMWTTLDEDFPGVAAINRGFGGSQVRDSTYFADRIVIPYRPDAVVFYAGDNDLAEGRTPEQVRDDFAAFVALVRAALPQVRIGFVSIKPSPSRRALLEQMRHANTLVRDYARRQRDVDYLDVFTPMLDAAGEPRAELFIEDGLHMNRNGYVLWAGIVRPWLARIPATHCCAAAAQGLR